MDLFAPGTIETYGLFAARCSAFIVAVPILGTATGFSAYRVTLSLALAACVYSAIGAPVEVAPDAAIYALWLMREVAIGLALAFGLQATLVAVRVGGEMIGQEMGFNLASLVDPQTGVSTPIIAQVYEVMFILGFLAVDGHHVLLRSVASSFERAPVGSLDLGASLPHTAIALFGQMFTAGVAFAVPVLTLLFGTSILLAILARAVPQFNVSEVGFTARVAAGLVAMFLFAPALSPALRHLQIGFERGLDGLLVAIGS